MSVSNTVIVQAGPADLEEISGLIGARIDSEPVSSAAIKRSPRRLSDERLPCRIDLANTLLQALTAGVMPQAGTGSTVRARGAAGGMAARAAAVLSAIGGGGGALGGGGLGGRKRRSGTQNIRNTTNRKP